MKNLLENTYFNKDVKIKAVDELVQYCKSSKKPIAIEEVFDLYESILDDKEVADPSLKSE